jgi:anthranilate synthase/aminodeoxychorismate synthase-like glutamine amidotransferase
MTRRAARAAAGIPSVLVIDNYDSFAHNLVHAFAAAGADARAVRNDAVTRDDIAAVPPAAIVLSPGPGTPAEARDFGVCAELIRHPVADVPMLGVCLGMQGMAHHTGGRVVRARTIVHGEASPFRPAAHALFADLGDVTMVGRYHSLCVDAAALPEVWQPLGATDDGILMAMAHRERPWVGVQFHPESILTPDGPTMIANFLREFT